MINFPHPLVNPEEIEELSENYRNQHLMVKPVVHLLTTLGYGVGKAVKPGQWLIDQINPDNHRQAWGLHDDGKGNIEYGEIDLDTLAGLRLLVKTAPLIERNDHFYGEYCTRVYEDAAKVAGQITVSPIDLVNAAFERNSRLTLNSLEPVYYPTIQGPNVA